MLRDGEPLALAPKALETLLALIEHRGRVLTKDELLQRIWGDTVVEEGGLTRNISVLRKALGETPDDHQYIVTVPGPRVPVRCGQLRKWPSRRKDQPAFEAPALVCGGRAGARDSDTLFLGSWRRPWRWVALGGLAALVAGALVYGLRLLQAV